MLALEFLDRLRVILLLVPVAFGDPGETWSVGRRSMSFTL
jgi:hypothetical protein